MAAILVTLFCLGLFLLMKVAGNVFGSTVGTVAGVGCLGLIGFGVLSVGLVLLLPLLMPVVVLSVACYMVLRMARDIFRPSNEKSR